MAHEKSSFSPSEDVGTKYEYLTGFDWEVKLFGKRRGTGRG